MRLIDADELYQKVKEAVTIYDVPLSECEAGRKALDLIYHAPTVEIPDGTETAREAKKKKYYPMGQEDNWA